MFSLFQKILAGTAFAAPLLAAAATAAADPTTAAPAAPPALDAAQIAAGFAKPAPENRPWVFWFWNNGNLNRDGITADLEAMRDTGIGGVLIMDVGQGAPRGPVDFLSDEWRALFSFMISEAKRCGIQVNMNNDAGWNGSGGKWITPELGMQHLTWTETQITAPPAATTSASSTSSPSVPAATTLPRPPAKLDHYRDIAVLAFPTPDSTGRRRRPNPNDPRPASAKNPVVARAAILDLTAKMSPDGTLRWDAPAGKWTILRIGHTCTGMVIRPAPTSGVGLECDKLSVAAAESAFNGQMGRLLAENRADSGVLKTLLSTHIDSWENASQTWTPLMRAEFQKYARYDILPYLPVFAGYTIDDPERTARFLWDFRRALSQIVLANYVGTFRRLAHHHGIRLSIEAYGSPCDYLQYGGMADEPIGEFWYPNDTINMTETCRGMASAAHVYGKNIIGAEAFTGTGSERWLAHPGNIKAQGDSVFAAGVNRFIFHRYSFQPWRDVRPGMMMGPWGTHYERTQTWWHLTPPWHSYLARCQFLLRQGHFAGDIAYIEPEDSPQKFSPHPALGYQWDQCGADAVLKMRVAPSGRVIPEGGGEGYALLVLPETPAMTATLLRKITALLQDGATIIGKRPQTAPGLFNYPENVNEVRALADTLWGNDPAKQGERQIGKGRLLWGVTPEDALSQKGIPRAFAANEKLNYIHRRSDTLGDIFFIANPENTSTLATVALRAGSVAARPELWDAETGNKIPAPFFFPDPKTKLYKLLLPLTPTQSLFVIIPPNDNGSLKNAGSSMVEFVNFNSFGTNTVRSLANLTNNWPHYDKAASAVSPLLALNFKGGKSPLQLLGPSGNYRWSYNKGNAPDSPKTRVVETKRHEQTQLPYPLELIGTWDIEFFGAKKTGETKTNIKVVADKLTSWSESPDTDIKYFSGTALYTKKFKFVPPKSRSASPEKDVALGWEIISPRPGAMKGRGEVAKPLPVSEKKADIPATTRHGVSGNVLEIAYVPGWRSSGKPNFILDLGSAAEIAEVRLNGRDLGILWKVEKRVDITDVLRLDGSENILEIRVTNLWPNRLIGDLFIPPVDEHRFSGGTIRHWPDWLLAGKPNPSGRHAFTMRNMWQKTDKLLPSGLLGPVRIHAAAAVE
ncbi:MAG: hypothetical protein LBT53_09000 [Puniceicoccales bacterium]|nr:hypothetical protein [Puniceicoccales bacterium]